MIVTEIELGMSSTVSMSLEFSANEIETVNTSLSSRAESFTIDICIVWTVEELEKVKT